MAPRRCLHGGKYGRVQAVIGTALGDFSSFDTWCMLRGINPLELPGYRFYNAALAWILDGITEPEEITKIENSLREADQLVHPFLNDDSSLIDLPTRVRAKPRSIRSDSTELSLEERTKKEFNERASRDDSLKNKFRVPDWWLGEDDAYKSSKTAQMGTSNLPKFG